MRFLNTTLGTLAAAAVISAVVVAQDIVPTTMGQSRASRAEAQRLDPRPLEPLDFDWGLGGVALPAGLEINEQWAGIGVHIWAINNILGHPDKAILFDSANPTGGDFDLKTPGTGPGNLLPQGKVLIIAEDDVDADADGLVDDPDDEWGGGSIFFGFDTPMVARTIGLLDVDLIEDSWMRCWLRSTMMPNWIGRWL